LEGTNIQAIAISQKAHREKKDIHALSLKNIKISCFMPGAVLGPE
jgi:hypothetical protein